MVGSRVHFPYNTERVLRGFQTSLEMDTAGTFYCSWPRAGASFPWIWKQQAAQWQAPRAQGPRSVCTCFVSGA